MSDIKMSILIPTINKRWEVLKVLLKEFNSQVLDLGQEYLGKEETKFGYCELTKYKYNNYEILTLADNCQKSIGYKRNELLHRCSGEYMAYFDDDDWASGNYFKILTKAIENKPDCCSLKGLLTSPTQKALFEHSLKYTSWKECGLTDAEKFKPEIANAHITYERPINHLNMIKSSIAKQFSFPDEYSGEDFAFSEQLRKSGLLKKEAYIKDILYHYRYSPNK